MKLQTTLKKYTMVIALVLVFILFSILTQGRLLKAQNMSNLLLQNSYVLVLACGMLLCILTGGNVDLSVGSTVCLVGALCAQLLDKTSVPAIPTILICLAVGALIGVWQGFWIGYVHIPPFICTLSGMFLFRGIGRVILSSKTVPVKNQSFLNIFASYIQVPGLDDKIKWSAFIVGVVVAAGLLISFFLSLPEFRMNRSDSHLSAVQELLERLVIAVIGYCKTASQIQSHHAKKRLGIHNVAAITIIGNVNIKIAVLCSVYKVLNITGVQINILGCSHRIPPSSQKARPFFVLFF
ncbi:MAG: hypothetical protein SOW29_00810 [Candidatus Faecousia sp.]|nr:hypothetical protein [Candidatus Faecousia sp.]